MFLSKIMTLAALILVSLYAPSALGQQAQTSSQPAKSDEYVTEKGFRGRVFELKHRDPQSLYNLLRPLSSGFKGATMSINQDFKTITVRDFPENIAVIEEVIKRLDTPETSRPGIEFHVHVVVASNVASPGNELPAELNDVIKQLQATLKYKNYGLMTSSIHRTSEGQPGVSNKGVAESRLFGVPTMPGNPIFYNYLLSSVSLENESSPPSTVQIRDFSFDMRVPVNLGSSIQYENVGFKTPVSIREGEKVVVGTTTIEDKGLIVVLTAKVLK